MSARLGPAGLRGILDRAIERARSREQLGPIERVVNFPGYRRRLRSRFNAWTRAERPVEGGPPAADPVVAAEWAVFGAYRALLAEARSEDEAGFAAWASRRLGRRAPAGLRGLGRVVVLDAAGLSRAEWRGLEWFGKASALLALLPHDSDPDLSEAYAPSDAARRRLLALGFEEEAFDCDLWRPRGLVEVERELFRESNGSRERPRAGVRVVGAPRGEGAGLVVARDVAALLRRGVEPDRILVLFRRWDEDADVVARVLKSWGLPVRTERGRPLASEPALSALRAVLRVPLDDWDAAKLARALRNSHLRPDWPEAADPLALAGAAAAVRSTRVHRGLDPILAGLGRALDDDERPVRRDRARVGLAVLERLAGLLGRCDRPRTWDLPATQLVDLTAELGIGRGGRGPLDRSRVALDALRAALDDYEVMLDRLGESGRAWTWPRFVREVEDLIGALELPPGPAAGGSVLLTTVDAARGARAAHVILANLAEGSFPDREAVAEGRAGAVEEAEDGAPAATAYAREMLRFLGVVGAADEGLTLVYPTVDLDGQPLLPAGFLDDVLRYLGIEGPCAEHERHERFDPSLRDLEPLARAPADARVRAVALACARSTLELERLARSPAHREALEGTADALALAGRRLGSTRFGPYDGRLADPAVIAAIGRHYGPEHVFSPSQLESYTFCPFQFYLKYVLNLEPTDERDEFEVDFAGRGSQVHRLLEVMEQLLRLREAERPGAGAEPDLAMVEQLLEQERDGQGRPESEVVVGLRRIEHERLRRTMRRYLDQRATYVRGEGGAPEPHRFEVVFGRPEEDGSLPELRLGPEDGAVRLAGQIDRVDLVAPNGEARFRVIDYKTGSAPTPKEVFSGLALQLPLYALAVERLGVIRGVAALADFGYWALGKGGYRSISVEEWGRFIAGVEGYVVEQVRQLRAGAFPIHPRVHDCQSFCDYRTVCRIHQVRRARKSRDDAPRFEWTK